MNDSHRETTPDSTALWENFESAETVKQIDTAIEKLNAVAARLNKEQELLGDDDRMRIYDDFDRNVQNLLYLARNGKIPSAQRDGIAHAVDAARDHILEGIYRERSRILIDWCEGMQTSAF